MPTRFYLDNRTAPAITPGYAAWGRTADSSRFLMTPTKDGSAMVSDTIGTITAANDTAAMRQYISDTMAAGIAFSTSDTIQCVIRAMESAVNDNINRQPLCLKVVSEDGTTVRATLKDLGHYGPNTTEWGTSLQSEILADSDTLDANYTTVAGDRLVLEVGAQLSAAGGASVTGTMSFGSDSGTDLTAPPTEHVATANNPWFEISRTITFAQIATPVTNGYSGPGLTAGTSYSYRARAADGAGNLSLNYSNTASATPPVLTNLITAFGMDEGFFILQS